MIPPDNPIVSPLLVGRERELDRLARALQRPTASGGTCFVIGGVAGVGKSRLLAEACQRALTAHWLVLRGHCFEQDASYPYAPWVDALRSFFASRPLTELQALGPMAADLVKLFPEWSQGLSDVPLQTALDPDAEKHRMFEALARFLTHGLTAAQSTDTRRPAQPRTALLIALEDLHWSDQTSLDFLQHFVRRLGTFPILLMVTYRDDEAPAGLSRLIAQLERQRQAEIIALGPLLRPDVEAMVRSIFSIERPIKVEFIDFIVSLSEGNPLFIEEILKALVAAGDIFYRDGRWERKAGAAARVPRSVQDAVQRRTAELSPLALQVLRHAAIMGQRFDFPLLKALTSLEAGELLGWIKELIAAQLVVETDAEQFAFRHALTRHAVYQGVLATERKSMHQTTLAALEHLGDSARDVRTSELAYHAYEAGQWAKAGIYAQQAGSKALALYAPQEALVQFSRAMDAISRGGESNGLRSAAEQTRLLMLHRERAQTYDMLGDFEHARTDYEAVLGLAQVGSDRHAQWQTLLDLGLLWASRDFAQSGDLLRQALELARAMAEPVTLAWTLNRVGNWHLNMGRVIEARQHHQEALDIFTGLTDLRGRADSLNLLGLAFFLCGDIRQGTRCYEQAIPLFRELGDRVGLIYALAHLCIRAQFDTEHLGAADISGSVPSGETAVRMAREIGWRSGEAMALILTTMCLNSMGEYGRALAWAQAALAIAEDIDHGGWAAVALWELAEIDAGLLALPAARSLFEAALAKALAMRSVIYVRLVSQGLASLCIAQNDLARAEAVLASAIDLGQMGANTQERMCWASYAQLSLVRGQAARALQIVDELIAAAVNPQLSEHDTIPRLAELRAEALIALGRLGEAAHELEATRDQLRIQGRRQLLWRVHLALGILYRTLKRPADAEREFAAARAVCEEVAALVLDPSVRADFLGQALMLIPTATSLSKRQADRQRFGGLTVREREVARLVAQGKSNHAIAAELVLSERTVAKHVENILSKLAFESRAQIAVWAVEIERLNGTSNP